MNLGFSDQFQSQRPHQFGDYNLGDMGISANQTPSYQGNNTSFNNLQSLYQAMQRENNQMPYLPPGMNQQMARGFFLPQPAQQQQQAPPSMFQPDLSGPMQPAPNLGGGQIGGGMKSPEFGRRMFLR